MMDEYLKAKRLGEKAFHQAVLEGGYPYVQDLESIVDLSTCTKTTKRIVTVPLEQVIGTVTSARQSAFAWNFMPLLDGNTEFAWKWSNLYDYQEEQGVNDPVVLYEYRHRFYVLEGNKRISVFKYLGMPTIRSEVMRIMPSDTDPLYEEFLAYEKVTGLYEPDFSKPGRYLQLARLFGKDLNEPWDDVTVSRLRSAYYIFDRGYRAVYGSTMPVSVSDAFYVYLGIYGTEGLLKTGNDQIETNIKQLHREFIADNEEANITLSQGIPSESTFQLRRILPRILPTKPLRVAFIYRRSPQTSNNAFEHEIGRIVVQNRMQEKLITNVYDDCLTDEKLQEALFEASQTADVVFTTSPTQMAETLKTALRYPQVKYMNCSLNQMVNAVRSYAVRMYEVKFLLGVLAALFARNHAVAYIADVPVYGTFADINAFAIGVALIDPKAVVYLCWSETLDADWKEQMERLGITVISGPDLTETDAEDTAYGIYQIEADGAITNLAAPVINWAVYYEKLLKMIMDGQWNSGVAADKNVSVNYWWGMSEGVADIRVSGRMPYTSRKLITLLKTALMEGTLNPFSGELHSQDKIIQQAYDPKLTDEKIIQMDWLNDNIIGTIPPYELLTETAKQLSDVVGVPQAKERP